MAEFRKRLTTASAIVSVFISSAVCNSPASWRFLRRSKFSGAYSMRPYTL